MPRARSSERAPRHVAASGQRSTSIDGCAARREHVLPVAAVPLHRGHRPRASLPSGPRITTSTSAARPCRTRSGSRPTAPGRRCRAGRCSQVRRRADRQRAHHLGARHGRGPLRPEIHRGQQRAGRIVRKARLPRTVACAAARTRSGSAGPASTRPSPTAPEAGCSTESSDCPPADHSRPPSPRCALAEARPGGLAALGGPRWPAHCCRRRSRRRGCRAARARVRNAPESSTPGRLQGERSVEML